VRPWQDTRFCALLFGLTCLLYPSAAMSAADTKCQTECSVVEVTTGECCLSKTDRSPTPTVAQARSTWWNCWQPTVKKQTAIQTLTLAEWSLQPCSITHSELESPVVWRVDWTATWSALYYHLLAPPETTTKHDRP
jgi:hypothetical protein